MLPADGGATYAKARVFSLVDGKHITDVKTRGDPLCELTYASFLNFKYSIAAMCVTYDCVRNTIWTYNDGKIDEWKNLGLIPKHSFPNTKSSLQLYPRFTPEAILSEVSFPTNLQQFSFYLKLAYIPSTKSVLPLQAVLIILANMDRLARQHPIYWEKVILEA